MSLRLHSQGPNAIDLVPVEATAALHPHRIKPELGDAIVSLNMNVRRLITITSIEEEPMGPLRSAVGIGPYTVSLSSIRSLSEIDSTTKLMA